jgi:hypothetical protein
MATLLELAEQTSPKAQAALLRQWPLNSWTLHSAHIRWFNRHRLIEQHNATDYRLTERGRELRFILRRIPAANPARASQQGEG